MQFKLFAALILAAGIAAGGYLAGQGIVDSKALDRTVTVKGLAEREVPADVAIWPIRFVLAGDDLDALYTDVEKKLEVVLVFLRTTGFDEQEVSVAAPAITDRQAQPYGDSQARFRYSATQTVTVYTTRVPEVLQAVARLIELGKSGIVLSGDDYQAQRQYLFTGLNDLKPAMIEEATRNAREVAEKFAADSDSRLGKIKTAFQGQFSIEDRDGNTPHIKKVRVVSTVQYYLAD
ncbi:MAG TPA: SIMPL domain-containing protein [Rhodothermales bacterium]|nr:SIMPL domain-containing protein [Rhodothermales bacterium]